MAIPARQRFYIGARVRFTKAAKLRMPGVKKENRIVCGFSLDPDMVRVRTLDSSHGVTYHMDFWELDGYIAGETWIAYYPSDVTCSSIAQN